MFLRGDVAVLVIVVSLGAGAALALADAPRGRAADRRADGRRLCRCSRAVGRGDRAAGDAPAGETAVPDRRRGIRLLHVAARAVHRDGAVLRRRGPRRFAGQAVQQDPLESGPHPVVGRVWVVKPVEVDDVPIVNVTLWSDQLDRYGDHELRRMAEEMQHELQAIREHQPGVGTAADRGGFASSWMRPGWPLGRPRCCKWPRPCA